MTIRAVETISVTLVGDGASASVTVDITAPPVRLVTTGNTPSGVRLAQSSYDLFGTTTLGALAANKNVPITFNPAPSLNQNISIVLEVQY